MTKPLKELSIPRLSWFREKILERNPETCYLTCDRTWKLSWVASIRNSVKKKLLGIILEDRFKF